MCKEYCGERELKTMARRNAEAKKYDSEFKVMYYELGLYHGGGKPTALSFTIMYDHIYLNKCQLFK